jgi:hypothetical protein
MTDHRSVAGRYPVDLGHGTSIGPAGGSRIVPSMFRVVERRSD